MEGLLWQVQKRLTAAGFTTYKTGLHIRLGSNHNTPLQLPNQTPKPGLLRSHEYTVHHSTQICACQVQRHVRRRGVGMPEAGRHRLGQEAQQRLPRQPQRHRQRQRACRLPSLITTESLC